MIPVNSWNSAEISVEMMNNFTCIMYMVGSYLGLIVKEIKITSIKLKNYLP